MDPIRKTNKHGVPVVSMDGGATWSKDEQPAPQAGTDLGGQGPAPSQRQFVPEGQLASNTNASKTWQDVKEGAVDAMHGVVGGLTSGWDDEVLGETYAKNKQQSLARSAARSAQAEQDLDVIDPRLGYAVPTDAAGAGEVGGAVAQAAMTGGALQSAGLVGKAGQAATTGQKLAAFGTGNVVQGAIAGAGNAEEGMKAEGALVGGAVGGVAGGVARGLGRGYSRLVSGESARAANVAADEARVRAANMSVAEAQAAPGGVARQAASQRELGLGKDLLTSKSQMRDQAGQALEQLGGERAGIEGKAAGASAPGRAVVDRLRKAQERLPGYGAGSELRNALEREAQAVPDNVSFEELGKKRVHFSDKNFQSGSPEANVANDMRGAYREAQIEAANVVEPGMGDRYGRVGELQQGAINAQEALGRGTERSFLNPYRWWEGTAGQYTPNLKAHAMEGYAGAVGAISPKTVNKAGLESGYESAQFLGTTAARQAHDFVNDPALDEQERAIRDYQESMRNLDYRHSR